MLESIPRTGCNRYKEECIAVRKMSMIMATVSAIGIGLGNASAGLMSTPPITSVRPALPVSYAEMTVLNKYGYANLRQKPEKHSKLLGKLPQGTKVIVIGSAPTGSWIHVRVGNKEGYVLANLLNAEENRQQASPTASASGTSQAKVQLAASIDQYRDGTYRGEIADAYYGLVQVQADIRGGRLVSVYVLQYPADRQTSRYINSQALPLLQSEVVSAQTARVDIVTGATLTSVAYLRSLNSALTQAQQ
jgi:uncharacterized protein with FMN-binding domain